MNLFLPMLGVGLVTSIHCVAMCGPLVLTYAVKGAEEGPLVKRMLPHFAYQTAKIFSYVLVGLLLGTLGSLFDVGGLRGWVTVFAGVFMVLLGLQMTGKFPILNKLTFKPPKALVGAIGKLRNRAVADEKSGHVSIATPITFGLLTGLMPCGPLQTAQIAAAGAGSPINGALAMLGFGLGTAPLMLGFGAVSGMLSAKFKQRMMVVAAILIALLGLVMLNRGLSIVGSPVTAQTIKVAVMGAPVTATDATQQNATGADGVVEIPLIIENTQFVPQTVSIPADTPVRLVVDRREANSCSAQIAMPQLGILKDLAPNAVTVVDIPATKAGKYTLTCGMGMMSGLLQVGATPATSGVPPAVPLAGVALLLLGIGLWWNTRRAGATMSPKEALIIGVAVAAAIIAGLSVGGMFTR
ncbi:MAG: sulfite exporter TauE/SafE family protein [Actinomycetota bacterium]|nr:sulfite exporter TauE/SafE family protein [Actinomycetota bacterium]MDP3629508.1 sulfite exporter TauE/SafE family protein [Actinomycetota bacterium]